MADGIRNISELQCSAPYLFSYYYYSIPVSNEDDGVLPTEVSVLDGCAVAHAQDLHGLGNLTSGIKRWGDAVPFKSFISIVNT